MDLKPPSNSNLDVEHSTFEVNQPKLVKNMPKGEALELCSLVEYQEGQVVSRTLAQNKTLNLTLFAFAQGEGLSTHSSTGDAMIQVLDGTGQFTIGDQPPHTVTQGQTIVLPANVPHAVDAPEKFKMLLTVVKPA